MRDTFDDLQTRIIEASEPDWRPIHVSQVVQCIRRAGGTRCNKRAVFRDIHGKVSLCAIHAVSTKLYREGNPYLADLILRRAGQKGRYV